MADALSSGTAPTLIRRCGKDHPGFCAILDPARSRDKKGVGFVSLTMQEGLFRRLLINGWTLPWGVPLLQVSN
jgi:hypothetical protein